MRAVAPAPPAILAQLEPLRRLLLVLERVVIPALALGARHRHHHAGFFFRHGRSRKGLGPAWNMKKTDAGSVPSFDYTTAARPCHAGFPRRAGGRSSP